MWAEFDKIIIQLCLYIKVFQLPTDLVKADSITLSWSQTGQTGIRPITPYLARC